AQDLRAEDFGTNTSDPFAILKVGHQVKKSKIITANLNPTWQETFEFECSSSG
ncbi:unnamed protein product, partial [Laminaria digitata]